MKRVLSSNLARVLAATVVLATTWMTLPRRFHRVRSSMGANAMTKAIDGWLDGLAAQGQGGSRAFSVEDARRAEAAAIDAYHALSKGHRPNEWSDRFVSRLTDEFGRAYASAEDYSRLATALYRARDSLRLEGPGENTRRALHLLAQMGEEALYTLSIRFPADAARLRDWRFEPEGAPRDCESGSASYFGVGLCKGDVVLTKSEAFSSALFSFRTPDTETFSHVTIPYFSAGPHVLLLESEPMGGEYEDPTAESEPARFAVYRLAGGDPRALPEEREQVERSVGRIVAARAGKARFNYRLDPRCEPGKYFCSEIAYCAYRDSGVDPALNPYAEKFWPKTSPEAADFIEHIADTRWDPIPLPSDVELNPAFRARAIVVQFDRVRDLRPRAAIIDEFIAMMREDPQLRSKYVAALNRFGERRIGQLPAAASDLSFLTAVGIPSGRMLAVFQSRLPREVTVKELAFYMHLEGAVIPAAMAAVRHGPAPAKEGQAVTLGELRARARPEIRARVEAFIPILEGVKLSPIGR